MANETNFDNVSQVAQYQKETGDRYEEKLEGIADDLSEEASVGEMFKKQVETSAVEIDKNIRSGLSQKYMGGQKEAAQEIKKAGQ